MPRIIHNAQETEVVQECTKCHSIFGYWPSTEIYPPEVSLPHLYKASTSARLASITTSSKSVVVCPVCGSYEHPVSISDPPETRDHPLSIILCSNGGNRVGPGK